MVKIKLCGFTNEVDVRTASKLGPDLIGTIVEIPDSPRSLGLDRAKRVLDSVGKDIARVAVTRLEDIEKGLRIAEKLKPDYLQIYSPSPAEELGELKARTGVGLMTSVLIPRKVDDISPILKRGLELSKVADFVMVDTRGPSGGGTGLVQDWEISAKIRGSIPKPVFLAGGLNPFNVGAAVKTVAPFGVDVASGIESHPGKKDRELMRMFIESARCA